MRHRVDGRKFGRDTGHRTLMYRNLVTDLLRYGRIETTEAKAKEIRPMAERIITRGKNGTLHDRRMALRFVTDTGVVARVFEELGPQYRGRQGGYTRLTKIGPRKGDAAPMAILELVEGDEVATEDEAEERPSRRR